MQHAPISRTRYVQENQKMRFQIRRPSSSSHTCCRRCPNMRSNFYKVFRRIFRRILLMGLHLSPSLNDVLEQYIAAVLDMAHVGAALARG